MEVFDVQFIFFPAVFPYVQSGHPEMAATRFQYGFCMTGRQQVMFVRQSTEIFQINTVIIPDIFGQCIRILAETVDPVEFQHFAGICSGVNGAEKIQRGIKVIFSRSNRHL